ncbi:MAG: uracil-DNA glycosylase [Myxococcota bacterium]
MADADELAQVIAGARALLDWEQEIGGIGFPPVEALPALEAATPEPEKAPRTLPVAAAGDRTTLDDLAGKAAACTRCRLHEGRTKSVFARGGASARLAFVGEGPGYNEDQQGLPFVGKAGQLLDKMIKAMGYDPGDVYICNVVKCRPPNNRTPKPDEAGACASFLEGQLDIVKPEVIVALGRCATENLGLVEPGGRGWRGRWGEWRGIPAMATYHPAFLLRSPHMKRPVWEDLQKVMARLQGS